jgi:ribosome-binding factor A
MKIDGRVQPAEEQHQQAINIAFLSNEDLRMLEHVRLSGDLKALQQYITVLEKVVPSLKHSQRNEASNANKARLQRIAYLRQVLSVMLEFTLLSG